ncbi:MAG TPA: restriction endonuclease subunit S [Ktedonobacteraceae bacterium]|nr:restriction endonuclease subunit S [Ktedonobacteraceae bacterium]
MAIVAQNINQKPGYKQTEVGMIPEDWEPTPLGLLSAFITKGATPTTYGFSWVSEGVLFLRSECVSEQGLDLTQSMFITPEAHNVLKRSEIRAGDILITITGNVGRVIYLSHDFGSANINQHIARIRITDSNVAADYVFHFLSQSTIRKYYGSIITGQAYPQISLKQVRDTRVPIPPTKSEQTAIATALSDTDSLIASLDRLIAKKRDIKQATMQQLLTGKRRLPGFSGEWEVKKLGEIAEIVMGQSPIGTSYNRNGNGYPLINGPTEFTDKYPIKIQWTNQPTKFCMKDDVLLCVRGSSTGRINIANDKYCIGRGIAAIHAKSGLDARYITFQVDCAVKNILTLTTGSTFPNIDGKSIRSIVVPLPSFSEQQAIAAVLSDMDAEIAALEQRRDKTRALKQGMMQELLTGKTRII